MTFVTGVVQEVMSIRYAECTYLRLRKVSLWFSLRHSGVKHDYNI